MNEENIAYFLFGMGFATITIFLGSIISPSVYEGVDLDFMYKVNAQDIHESQEIILYKFQALNRPMTVITTKNNTAFIEYDYSISNLDGSSMQPSIMEGDVLLMRRVENFEEIKEGWIVHCEIVDDNGVIVESLVHRVVGAYRDYLILQGDHNAYPDSERCYENQTLGYVTTIIYGGKIRREK